MPYQLFVGGCSLYFYVSGISQGQARFLTQNLEMKRIGMVSGRLYLKYADGWWFKVRVSDRPARTTEGVSNKWRRFNYKEVKFCANRERVVSG